MIVRSSDFFMELSEALARTSINRLTEFRCLADVLDSDIVVLLQIALRLYANANCQWMQ